MRTIYTRAHVGPLPRARSVYDTEVAPHALRYVRAVPAAFLRLVLAGAHAGAAAAAARARTGEAARGGASGREGRAAGGGSDDESMGGDGGTHAWGGSGAGAAQGGAGSSPCSELGGGRAAALPSSDLAACLARADADARTQMSMQVRRVRMRACVQQGVCHSHHARTGSCARTLLLFKPFLRPICLQEWHLRLMYMTYEALGVMRMSEMFEIVVEYPDSHAAVSGARKGSMCGASVRLAC